MAYLNLLLSVPTSELNALRKDPTYTARYTKLTAVSHLLAYWIKTQPLGDLLGKAIDGGDLINDELWHPLRNPVFHSPDAVTSLHDRIAAEWKQIDVTKEGCPFDYFGPEIDKLLSVFHSAMTQDECVVSILEPPADKARADRVAFPFEPMPDTKADSDVESSSSFSPFWYVAGGAFSLVIAICAWRFGRYATKRNAISTPPVNAGAAHMNSNYSAEETAR